MRTTLVTSPHVRHSAVLQNDFRANPAAMYSFAPVGLLSLIAATRDANLGEPALFDLNRRIMDGTIALDARFYERAARSVYADEPDVVGFMTECDSYHHVLQICEALRRIAPRTRIVLGGPHATAVAGKTLRTCGAVDAIVCGEGERSFVALLDTWQNGREGAVAGTLARLRSGAVVDGGTAPMIEALDSLPMPAYDVYHADPGEEIFIEVGRGCPFQCTFCSTAPYWQRRHRAKSPQRILAEVALVQSLFGSTRVHFTHDLFTTVRPWVEDVCEAFIAAGVPVRWTCSARTDTVDELLLARMAAAGCNAIYFGIESGSARVLREIRKPIPIEHSLEVLRACRRIGIAANAGFIVGFPCDDEQSVGETFDAFEEALAAGARPVHIFGFCPFAGASMDGTYDKAPNRHFVDLVVTPEVDDANHDRIAADDELFGAYWRPRVDLGREGILQGADEFSPLVDALPTPSILIARCAGGMHALFRRWIEWIGERNDRRGASPHRRYYGSPVDYCDFLIGLCSEIGTAPAHVVTLLRVARTTLTCAATSALPPPTTMATHRSVLAPETRQLALSTRVTASGVVATMECDFILRDWLLADSPDLSPPAAGPFYLAWQMSDRGNLRLVEVTRSIFLTLHQTKHETKSAAEIFASTENPDVLVFLEEVRAGVDAGLLALHEAHS